MKIIATSDIHGFLPEIPECDLCIVAGDISPFHFQHNNMLMRSWLETNFTEWLNKQPTVGIAGNHDFVFAENTISIWNNTDYQADNIATEYPANKLP